ncbi:MAG TPA: efflux RND transporter periplasmic adaptor subunit [Thermodesulfobacteriota bacterium]|nr:efflux RND transporter periplasmic adaptor subunit [Thermodesulfobacteriota bacterium]
MRRFNRFFSILAASVLLSACGNGDGGDSGKPPQAERPHNVTIWTARKENVTQKISLVGTLEPEEEVMVASSVAAKAISVLKDEGDFVRKDEELLLLDSGEFTRKVEKSRADLNRARAELDFAENDFKRKVELLKEDLISKDDYENSLSRRDSAKATVESIKAALNLATLDLAHTRVPAPFPGRIAERYVSVGSYVKEGDRLFRLMDVSNVKVSAEVPEGRAGEVREGQSVLIRVSSIDFEFSGSVYFISPDVDKDTRTFRIKARVKNEREILKPGLFANVEIVTGVLKDAYLVPENAIVPGQDGFFVYVALNGAASMRKVSVAERQDGSAVITSGINEGDAVVADGAQGLAEGAKLNVRQ